MTTKDAKAEAVFANRTLFTFAPFAVTLFPKVGMNRGSGFGTAIWGSNLLLHLRQKIVFGNSLDFRPVSHLRHTAGICGVEQSGSSQSLNEHCAFTHAASRSR